MKQDIKSYNDKDQPHGLWIYYFSDGNLDYKGHFSNGLEHGYWISNWTIVKPDIVFYIK